jgi:hypothetical protein
MQADSNVAILLDHSHAQDGGFEFKKCITDSIVHLMHAIPETKESSLLHLCEFIEDCEFTEVCH